MRLFHRSMLGSAVAALLAVSGTAGSASGSINSHTAGTVSSNTVTVTPAGGTGTGYTFSYSCPGGVSASQSGNQVTFSGSCGPQGSLGGNAVCTITDSQGHVGFVNIPISLSNSGWPTLSVSGGGTVNGSITSSSAGLVTSGAASVSYSGGGPSVSVSWSTPAGITVDSPTSVSTTFSKTLGPGASATGTSVCTVTSADGQVLSTVAANINLANNGTAISPISASTSVIGNMTPSRTGTGSATLTTGTATVTGTGGQGALSYTWVTDSNPGGASVNVSGNQVSFSKTDTGNHDWIVSGHFHITDAFGHTPYDQTVSAEFIFSDGQ